MQDELLKFLSAFRRDLAALIGDGQQATCGSETAIQDSPLWRALSDMYDYGVCGIPSGDLAPGARLDEVYAHAEIFLRALDHPAMRLYLESISTRLPELALDTAQTAVARLVLDGGDRFTDFGAHENGIRNGDRTRLTLAELALLANMDERSVRNAANPKLPDPLKTELVGKRSLVDPEEAKRWLAGRKGFVPTQASGASAVERAPEFNLQLTEELVDHVEREAKRSGMSFNAYLKQALLAAIEEAKE